MTCSSNYFVCYSDLMSRLSRVAFDCPQFTSRVWKDIHGTSGGLVQPYLGVSSREEWTGGESEPGCGFCGRIARIGRGSGQRSCLGPKWLRTRSATPPLTSPPSSVYWGTSRFWRLGIRVRPRLLQWTTGSGLTSAKVDSSPCSGDARWSASPVF
jgi:hypothetical protein